METLFNKQGKAIIRLYDDWFVAYNAAKHLGWLNGDAVHNQSGKHIGWLDDGILRDLKGKIVAKDTGSVFPGMAGIPGRPGRPGMSGVSGRSISGSWADTDYIAFFTS